VLKMRIYSELVDLNTFEAWSGAINTLDRIRREGKCEELESVLEELYPEGIDKTALNDLLWFESETVYEWVGLRTESQIKSEIEEAKSELADLEDDLKVLDEDYNTDCEDVSEIERERIWIESYSDDRNSLISAISLIKENIAELEEELKEA
jgi:hypothetical protein